VPAADFTTYYDRLLGATKDVAPAPTEAQREAANYRHGKLHVHGLDIRIEVVRGGTRTGVGSDGKPWSRKMYAHYGRIKRTVGADGEPVDVYIGEHPESQLVFIVSQLTEDGNLDEYKVMLGFLNYPAAKAAYLAHYPDNWERTRLGEIRGMTMPEFKQWLDSPASRGVGKKKAAFDYYMGLLNATQT
jgi:hypothetical protein